MPTHTPSRAARPAARPLACALALACAAVLRPSPASAAGPAGAPGASARPALPPTVLQRVAAALTARHGAAEAARIDRGVRQAASLWRAGDGDAAAFQAFALEQFAPAGPPLDTLFHRLEGALEQLDGHALAVNRELARFAALDLGPMAPVDPLLSAWDASAHLTDDLFDGKLAFAALLNFPLTTLDERLREGRGWSRRQWAEARLAGRFARRVPAEVNLGVARAFSEAELYIGDYNVFAHHLVGPGGERLFPKGKRLLSHWNLRDELKSQYGQPGGLERQRLIARVMERIVTQTIPRAAVNDPAVDWDPVANTVRPAPGGAPRRGPRWTARASPTPGTRASWPSSAPSRRPTRTSPRRRPSSPASSSWSASCPRRGWWGCWRRCWARPR